MTPKSFVFDAESHVYTVDGLIVPSVTQVLQSAGLIDFSCVPKSVLERAADFGNAVHKATALEDKGELDHFTLDISLQKPLDAWNKFKKDFKFVSSIIERPMYCEKYGFAGTPDRIGTIGRDDVLVDIKTGVMTKTIALQTAGYEILAPFRIARRIGVQLNMDGTYKIEEYKDKTDRRVFLSCLNVANWKQK